jgi:hypothetical protein
MTTTLFYLRIPFLIVLVLCVLGLAWALFRRSR